jgi:glycosyltransferase involved in cell wall biosynthesis
VVLTWFHVASGDERLRFISEVNQKVSLVHTSCEITKNKLLELGIDNSKITVIPLGIDLKMFKPLLTANSQLKRDLSISSASLVIGSFQKDGNGWGIGNAPKLIKGPDIFCNVIERLSQKHPVHVLLTGPARGYVIKRLNKSNVKYTHVYLKKFEDIVKYYQILDLYLICSREEGGPKALLESMACGVSLVSTKVGMAPEIIENGLNGYLAEVGDENQLFYLSDKLLSDSSLRKNFAEKGLEKIVKYNHSLISKIYWDKIYSKLVK